MKPDGKDADGRAAVTTSLDRRLILLSVCALLAGLALRLLFIFRYAHIQGDALVYGDIASNLLRHGVYGFTEFVNGAPAPPHATLIRLPGYPLFLALCFLIFGVGYYTAVLVVQGVMDLGTCLLLACLARRLCGERAFLPALWLGTLCPFTANYTAAPLTETPTLFSIALAFYALVRWRESEDPWNRWVGALAFALGWAILLRPEQGMLAACVVPAMLWPWRRAHVAPVALTCVLTLLPLAPWAARNWHTFHQLQPLAPRNANDPGESVPTGFQRWYRTWAIDFTSTDTVYWQYDGGPIQVADLPNRAFDSNAQYDQTAALLDAYNESDSATSALDHRFAALADARVRADPARYYLLLPAARVLNMALRPRTENLPVPLEWWKAPRKPGQRAFAFAYAALNLAYFVLAGVGLWRSNLRSPVVLAMLATVILRILLLLTIDNSEPRYTLEFFPVLIVLGAAVFSGRRCP